MEISPNKFKKQINSKSKSENDSSHQLDQASLFSMLESSPVNVMLADRDGIIVYINEKSKQTLLTIEEHLSINVSEIVGSSYDVFHKNPAH